VQGFPENRLPSGLEDIKEALHDLKAIHSHLDFSASMSNFITSILASAPLNHPLYAVSWKLRRIFTDKMRLVSLSIDNHELFTKEIPNVDKLVGELDEGSDMELTENIVPYRAQTAKHAQPVSQAKPDHNTNQLLARLSALESQITQLTGKKVGTVQVGQPSVSPLSANEISQVEEMIGSLPDNLLEKLIEEKLRGTKAIRYEKDSETGDDLAVIDIAVLAGKDQRTVRKWVIAKLGMTQKKVREQGKIEKAKEIEDHVEKLLEKRKKTEEMEKEEMLKLRNLQRREEEMKKYLGMIEEDIDSGSDLD